MCKPAEILTKYVLNTLMNTSRQYDWPAWVLPVATEYVRNTLQYVTYRKTTQYNVKGMEIRHNTATRSGQYIATTQGPHARQYTQGDDAPVWCIANSYSNVFPSILRVFPNGIYKVRILIGVDCMMIHRIVRIPAVFTQYKPCVQYR